MARRLGGPWGRDPQPGWDAALARRPRRPRLGAPETARARSQTAQRPRRREGVAPAMAWYGGADRCHPDASPLVLREGTAAPCAGATYAPAMVSWWTSMPRQRVRDCAMVDLRAGRVDGPTSGGAEVTSAPPRHIGGATSRYRKSLCLGAQENSACSVRLPCFLSQC